MTTVKSCKYLMRNLICSCIVQCNASFIFFLITFYLKNFPGTIYVNAICFACADIIAYTMSGVLLKYFKITTSLTIAYCLGLFSAVFYMFIYSAHESLPVWVIPLVITIGRVGGSMSYNI